MAFYRGRQTRGGLDYQERKSFEAKKQREEELEALCVVGYASKLFKDDSTAMAIHRGEYLVPWMGDNSHMIDRFDGRGHLSDLSEFDRVHSWNQIHQLSEEEARIEAICDEERYLALRKDLMEEETRREEEHKRLQHSMGALSGQSYGEVAPIYGEGISESEEYDPTMPTEDDTEKAERLARERAPTPELEQPFVAPASLQLPEGVETPATQKLNMIIERTSAFIAQQNPQMEIVIKARQANNPQFDFLNYDHYLNPYYRHITKCIKEGTYVPAPAEKEKEAVEDSDSDGEGYLHPGLLGSSNPPKAAPMPAVVKPPASTYAYSTTYHSSTLPSSSIYTTTPSSVTPEPSEPVLPKPSLVPLVTNVAPPVIEPVPEPPPQPENTTGETELLAAYYANAASELVNAYLTTLAASAPPPPPGAAEAQLQTQGAPVASAEVPELNGPFTEAEDNPNLEDSEPALPIIPPPPDIQPIIDKLAEFVAKNGDEFEEGVKLKGDPRFNFMNTWHSFYRYYEQKKIMYRQDMEQKAADLAEHKAPVSFSIKPRDIDERIRVGRNPLPVEESDSEDDLPEIRKPPVASLDQAAGMTDLINLTKQQIALAMVEASIGKAEPPSNKFDPNNRPKIKGLFKEEEKPMDAAHPLWDKEKESTDRAVSVDYNHGRPRPTPIPPSVPPPPRTRELSRLSENLRSGPGMSYEERMAVKPPPKVSPPFISREELARRQAEKAKLEDKLAKATREKMAGISKDRQLQMERRKKAALFMSRMKDQPVGDDLDGDRRQRDYGRRSSSKRERSPPSKATPKAYQIKFAESRRRRSSRSRSPPPKRSTPPVPTAKAKTEVTSTSSSLTPFRKKSSSRESSPGSNGSSTPTSILKKTDIPTTTLGGILKKKKPTIEERKARIKKLVESSKQKSSNDEVVEID